jgi:hypothetical protein
MRWIGLALALGLTGCGEPRSPADVRDYLGEERAGFSADYVIVKWRDRDDVVAGVFGFANDAEACADLANFLNMQACSETDGQNCINPFSCQRMN